MDDYMNKYMIREGEEVQHWDKSVDSSSTIAMTIAPYALSVMFPILVLYFVYGTTHLSWLDVLGMMAPLFLLMPLLSVLFVVRVLVTSQHIVVKQGFFGPNIPIKHVISCRVVEHRLRDIFRIEESTSYTGLALRGKRVEIVWQADGNKHGHAYITVRDPHALVAAIERQRAMDDTESEVTFGMFEQESVVDEFAYSTVKQAD